MSAKESPKSEVRSPKLMEVLPESVALSSTAGVLAPSPASGTSNPEPPHPARARYIMIGGFLGAGKTTSVARLAEHLARRGLKVGLITNDQGSALVDTAMLRSRGFATEEISGGCFCCRFHSLVEAAHRLTAATRPDVFIAEPVGSCTDLVATVSYPLRRIYGGQFTIAPLSVLLDPIRAERVLGLAAGGKFSDKVLYIYRKQLEEADLIVINKCELLDAGRMEALRAALHRAFPRAEVLEVSARTGAGLGAWFARIDAAGQSARAAMAVDYDVYAEGEALLGWLNATVQLARASGFDANRALEVLARRVQGALHEAGGEIAHLKMTFSSEGGLGELAVINLVRSDFVPELSQTLDAPVAAGQVIVNLRAEAAPETLRGAVEAALAALSAELPRLEVKLEHLEYFRPGKPTPTHRLVEPA